MHKVVGDGSANHLAGERPLVKFTRLSGHIGADVHGLDLSQPLGRDEVTAVREGLLEHLVLFFREQNVLTVEQHRALAAYFGDAGHSIYQFEEDDEKVQVFDAQYEEQQTRCVLPFVPFHADISYLPNRPLGAFLQAHEIPPSGGDTCFASMYAAYDALSPSMRAFLDRLEAYHSLAKQALQGGVTPTTKLLSKLDEHPPAKLPVVHRHPDTGRKFLNVNPIYTTQIDGMHEEESNVLLQFLFDHTNRPEFQVRLHWNVGDIAFWDNWSTQHTPVQDYGGHRRMQRIAVMRRPSDAQKDDEVAA
jgi:taurine dioxygenase